MQCPAEMVKAMAELDFGIFVGRPDTTLFERKMRFNRRSCGGSRFIILPFKNCRRDPILGVDFALLATLRNC